MISNVLLILPLLVVINGQSNCSLYNWCGSHGYCLNPSDNEWSCECKFWWEGKVCNRQSTGGIQVIVLGCLVGFLVLTFFGLQIGRLIYKKKKNKTENKPKDTSESPKLVHIAIDHVKRSAQLTSCLIGILTIIIAAATLIAKWSIVREIHAEVVAQYIDHPNDPLYVNRSSICDIIYIEGLNLLTFPFACLIALLCIIVTKRISLMKNTCHGYGAPAMPLDFLLHKDRKLAAVVFAIIADELLRIIQNIIFGGSNKVEGVLLSYLFNVALVLHLAVKFYPILAAVHINGIFVLICATLYTWAIYSFTIVQQAKCGPNYYPTPDDYASNDTDINDKLKYFGTGPSLIALQLCTDIPKYVCYAYLSVKLPMMIIEKILKRRKETLSEENILSKSLTREENLLIHISQTDSVEMRYVKNLFLPIDRRPRSHALFARLIPKFIYEWRDDFRFSSRVLCLYSSLFLLLFFFTIQVCVEVIPELPPLRDTLQAVLDGIINPTIDDDDQTIGRSSFPLPRLVRPFLLAVAMTTTIIVIQLLVLLVNIRRNLLQVFRGDDSEIPRRQRSKYVAYATGNFHFAGYFIGYLIWGFIMCAVFSSIVCLCIDAFVVYGSVRALEKALKGVIPGLLITAFKLYLNKLLAQYVFLQHCGDVLALNNRRVLMIFIYLNFFLDAFLGLVSSILRLVKSVIGGMFYMCRLDYSPLGRKLESYDSGFKAYCGFIHTECTHRHPIMLVFVSHLFYEMKKRRLHAINSIDTDDLSTKKKDSIGEKKSSRYIRKWRLAAFLIRNPFVVFFRKAFLRQLPLENRQALNDVDNNNEYNIHRAIAVYTRQMAAQRPSIVEGDDSSQTTTLRF